MRSGVAASTETAQTLLLRHWRGGVAPLVSMLGAMLLSVLVPLFPKWAIDLVVVGHQSWLLLPLITAYALTVVSLRFLSYLHGVLFFRFQVDCILAIQEEMLQKLFAQSMEFFDRSHTGYLIGRIRGDVAGLTYVFSESIVLALMDALKFFLIVPFLVALDRELAVWALLVAPFLVTQFLMSRARIAEVNQRLLEENARVERELSDALQGMEVLKSCSMEWVGLKRTRDSLVRYQATDVSRAVMIARYQHSIEALLGLADVLVLYQGVRHMVAGVLTLGGYAAFVGYLVAIHALARNIGTSPVLLDYAKESWRRVMALVRSLPGAGGTRDVGSIQSVALDCVRFAYGNSGDVLSDLSCRFERGERVVLRGGSGSGKSTVGKLLLGFYRPSSGRVLFNDVDLQEISLDRLRARIGYISQNVFLFNSSIRSNIVLGLDGVSDQAIWDTLRQCGLEGTVQALPDGLEHIVSERGLSLSGGERQRLSLARALVKRPDVIVIDEGTSNLDPPTEDRVLSTIERQFAESLVIHIRHSETVRHGWRVITLTDGGRWSPNQPSQEPAA